MQHIKRAADAEILRARLATRRVTGQAVGWFVVAGLGLMGLAMLLLAAFFGLSTVYGHTVAALIVGGSILVIAGIVALFIGPLRSRKAELEAKAAAERARADLAADFSKAAALMQGLGIGIGSGSEASKNASRLLGYAAMGIGLGVMLKKVGRKSKKA